MPQRDEGRTVQTERERDTAGRCAEEEMEDEDGGVNRLRYHDRN